MSNPADTLALVLVGPHVARATTLPDACARIVHEVGVILEKPCAVLCQTGKAWQVQTRAPQDFEWPPADGVDITIVPLGVAGGVARQLAIVQGGPSPLAEPAWLAALESVLTDALALVALRAERQLLRRNDRGRYRFARELLLIKDGSRLRQLIVERLARSVAAEMASLAIYLPSEDALVIAATYGYPAVLVDHIRIRPGEGVMGDVFARRRATCAQAPRTPANASRYRRYRGSSYMAVPLVTADGVLGVVSVTERANDEPFTREHLRILRGYAVPAALALAREALRDQTTDLAHLAAVDALTGAWNRRHFDERLLEEIQRARRDHSDLALLMIDIDDFKALNDAKGHLSGDRVLREVADIMRRSIRSFDVCARYGGEEFAVLMPGATAPIAVQVGERIRRHTESHFATSGRFPPHVRPTLSVGVSTARPDMTGEALIATADMALAWAKAAGKNVVKQYVDTPARNQMSG
jgi:diguanylate cyclase (GGDEF)-like protein